MEEYLAEFRLLTLLAGMTADTTSYNIHLINYFQRGLMLRLQTIKAIVNSRRFKGSSSDEPRRVQVLDLYCLTRFESEGSRREDVY